MYGAVSVDISLQELVNALEVYGMDAYDKRTTVDVQSVVSIDDNVPSASGVYWIETTMPLSLLQEALTKRHGKTKKTRKHVPRGTKLIKQEGKEYYVAYSGTEDDIRKRLKQHLFDYGHEGTARLGCDIAVKPFSDFQWKIGYSVIESYEIRYAVEAWWRLNVGWPAFCLR